MKGSVTEWEHYQSRSPGLVSMGEFRSLAARLLWDLNHCKASREGLWRTCHILKPDASQITSKHIHNVSQGKANQVSLSPKCLLCLEKECSRSPTYHCSESGSCSQSFAVILPFPLPGRSKQNSHLQLRLGKSYGTAQLSTWAQLGGWAWIMLDGCWGC